MVQQLAGDATNSEREVAQRLVALGFLTSATSVSEASRSEAVSAFQQARGLDVTGRCDVTTWHALLEAEHQFGVRALYLTSPMLRGDDVATLQLMLGSLGFDAGRVDGIFGPDTHAALRVFQRNVGLVVDGVCAHDSVTHLVRLTGKTGAVSVAGIRERENLSNRAIRLAGLRVAICHRGADPSLVGALAADLHAGSAIVSLQELEHWSDHARSVNDFAADVCLAVEIVEQSGIDVAYYATDGFESSAGRALAETLIRELPHPPGWRPSVAHGMRLPILRETRCPSVRLRLGPPNDVAELSSLIVAASARALRSWIEPSPTD